MLQYVKLDNEYPNVQFTYECETNDFIHFMDVKVVWKFDYLQTRT